MLHYEDCSPFCSDDQLIAIQLVTGSLTGSPLMGSQSLHSLLNDLNSSYPLAPEYGPFCKSRPDLTCIDDKNAIIVLAGKLLNNFTLMSRVMANRDNFELVETLIAVENPMQDGEYGRSVVEYVQYLGS